MMLRLAETSVFDVPLGGGLGGSYLAEVVSVNDPDSLSRVQVRLLCADGVADHDGPVWARVAVPFAGDGYGAFFLPDVGDEVLVSFVNGDTRLPIVLGSLWNGNAKAPDTLGGGGQKVDRWAMVGKKKTRIRILEEQDGQAVILLETPNGVSSATLSETGGGKIELKASGTTITVDSSGVSVQTSSQVQVQGSTMKVTAGQVTVDAAMAKFSGIVKCEVLQATTVIGTTYTPGAGNVW